MRHAEPRSNQTPVTEILKPEKTIKMELIILAHLALIPAIIAKSKGRSFFGWYIYGLFLFIIAFIHSLLVKPNSKTPGMQKCAHCASLIPKEARICAACGNPTSTAKQTPDFLPPAEVAFKGEHPDLSSVEYQDYLVRKYNLRKNDVLNRYIFKNEGFDTLSDALSYLNKIESETTSDPTVVHCKGKIGPNAMYDYVCYGNGRTVVSHSSGYKREFESLSLATEHFSK